MCTLKYSYHADVLLVPVLHVKSSLLRDRVPTYLVSEWDAVCTMWDGDAISGPVPTLYADNVEHAKKAIVADPAKAHQVRYILICV